MNVGLYVRVSTQEQVREGYSIDEQKERLTKYTESMGWTVYGLYSDPGFSGANLDRPALQALIQDVEDHKLEKVVVYKLDRLSRSQKDTLYLIEDVFMKNGVDFVSMTESFDTSTPFGKAIVGILSVFAQLEREQIKERMTIGREGRAKSGLWSGNGDPPIGYTYEDGQLKIDPYDAEIVKKIYADYLSGKTIGAIAKDFEKSGIKSRYGSLGRTTIRYILGNTTYAGFVHYGDKVFKGQHEAIISEEDSSRARELLQDAIDNDQHHLCFSKRASLLAGLVWCGDCGGKMESRYWYKRDAAKTPIRNFVCKNKGKTGCKNPPYRREEIEEVVLSQVRQLKLDPDFIARTRSKKPDEDIDVKIKIYEDKIESNTKKISRYMDLYAIQGINADDLTVKIDDCTTENATLTDEIQKLKESKNYILTDTDIADRVDRLEGYLDESDTESARKIIATLIDRIELSHGDTIKIYWTF